ncbi:hypothetical protein [Actinomadura rayongensis]|uniref:Uncharacterized protein n=1 Tax=Actinomadura rayongensis TaxID=1429076 RepID=A0A6I4WF40_9ACTN|nr:hypothetical protein [Actinomadura rayongensis]MXQ66476.1 hypothetical protein [Actinomadura rayongensis]
MGRSEFVVPSDEEVLVALGVEPRASGTGEFTRAIRLVGGSGEELDLSYDVVERSVRLRLNQAHGPNLDIFYEGAELFRLWSDSSSYGIALEFRTGTSMIDLKICVHPKMAIASRCLLV